MGQQPDTHQIYSQPDLVMHCCARGSVHTKRVDVGNARTQSTYLLCGSDEGFFLLLFLSLCGFVFRPLWWAEKWLRLPKSFIYERFFFIFHTVVYLMCSSIWYIHVYMGLTFEYWFGTGWFCDGGNIKVMQTKIDLLIWNLVLAISVLMVPF